MVQHTFYMISSIIMMGAEDRKTLSQARKVAKEEAIKLSKCEEYKDQFVTIDKYNNLTMKNILLEEWKYSNGNFISNKIGVDYK